MLPEKSGGSTDRMHPSASDLLGFFDYGHLPEALQAISKPCADLAWGDVRQCRQ